MDKAVTKPLQIKNYLTQKEIGRGAISIVYVGIDQITGKQIAIKVIDQKTMNGQLNTYFEKEIGILRTINEKQKKDKNSLNRVTDILDMIEDGKCTYVISEYCTKGDLYNYVTIYHMFFNEEVISQMMYQIIQGIGQLHAVDIIHRDLKPENILLTEIDGNLHLKLTDFGISTHLNLTQSQVGTVNYMAPEIILNKQYTNKIDIWSFGCVAYEIITNKQLFTDVSQLGICKKIKNFKQFNTTSQEYKELFKIIEQCLQIDPNKRPSAQEIKIKLEEHLTRLNQNQKQQIAKYQEQNKNKEQYSSSSDLEEDSEDEEEKNDERDGLINPNDDKIDINLKKNKATSSFSNTEVVSEKKVLSHINNDKINVQDVRQMTEARPREVNPLQYLVLSYSFISKLNLKQLLNKTVFYPFYRSDKRESKQHKEKLILVCLSIIKNYSLTQLEELFTQLNFNPDDEQERLLKETVIYLITNATFYDDKIKYFIQDLLRIKYFQQAIQQICGLKEREIESIPPPPQISECIDYLNNYIPQNKFTQLCSFTQGLACNKIAYCVYAMGILGIFYLKFSKNNSMPTEYLQLSPHSSNRLRSIYQLFGKQGKSN